MDINSINTIQLPASNTFTASAQKQSNTSASKANESAQTENKFAKKHHSKLPYVAGAVILAGLGIYASRNKLKNLLNKKEIEVIKEEILDQKQEFKLPKKILKRKRKPIIEDNLKNIAKDTSKKTKKTAVTDFYKTSRHTIKLNDKAVLSKIASIKKGQIEDVERIIKENTHDGKIDMPMMHKIARDFAGDKAGRGENRYHQAADLLEQAYVKRYVKGGANQKEGLQDMFDLARSDSPLFEIYTRMPMEEAATRLRVLADNDLKSAKYKGMNSERFFEKAMERMLEKFQFKKYNEAHGIKPEF